MHWKELSLKQKISTLVVVIIVTIFANWIGLLRPVFSLLSPVLSPITVQVNALTYNIQRFGNAMATLGETGKKIDQLERDNEKLLTENTTLKELERENEFLKQQLGFKESRQATLIPASIIGKEPVNFIKYLLINQGASAGIVKNMVVVSPEGLLVGQVIEVNQWQSKVLIITDGDSVVPALVQSTRTDGIVKGQSFGYGLLMEFIPLDAPLKKNDVIITSGLGGVYPKGLYIGVVSSIESSPSDVFQRALVRPQVNFNQLEMVAVIISAKVEE